METKARAGTYRHFPTAVAEKPLTTWELRPEEGFASSGESAIEELAGHYHKAWTDRVNVPKCEIGILPGGRDVHRKFHGQGMPRQSAYQFHPEALRRIDGAFQKFSENLVDDGVRYGNREL